MGRIRAGDPAGKKESCPTCGAVSEVYSCVVGYLRPVNQTFKIAQDDRAAATPGGRLVPETQGATQAT